MTNGTLIGNRYEIVETIGKGGMAIVYKAKCLVLNRYVALKVLRPEFREDKEFLARFKAEAQSAGSLSHPNIVSIYDVVQEEDLDYIVMEYVEGVTLKQYIDAKGIIPWREAVDYAGQICSGLDHAHKKGIIHKDIKPHNILITREGTLKITDFGIAKVMSSSTITTGNATMGSVHYFSPEQARGGYMDNKTDIYSLGVVLYEMVTGKLPFLGDSAIAIAMQHIEKDAEAPSSINPDIPESLENVIGRAMRKEQSLRYDSVAQLMVDLKKVYLGGKVDYSDLIYSVTTATPVVTGESGGRTGTRSNVNVKQQEKSMPEEMFIARQGDKKKSRALPIIAGILAGLVLVVMLFFGGKLVAGLLNAPSKVIVPDLVGMTLEEAEEALEQANLEIEIKEEENESVDKDTIISQSPEDGEKVKEDTVIKVVVSLGKGGFPMKNLVGYRDIDAENFLRGKNITFTIVKEQSATIPEGEVIRQTPTADTIIDEATTVTLYVSEGKSTALVPKLSGMTLEEAKLAVEDADLTVGKIVEATSSKPKGTVFGQSPSSGIEVLKGTEIDIRVSSGVADKPDEPSEPETPSTGSNPSIPTIVSPNAG